MGGIGPQKVDGSAFRRRRLILGALDGWAAIDPVGREERGNATVGRRPSDFVRKGRGGGFGCCLNFVIGGRHFMVDVQMIVCCFWDLKARVVLKIMDTDNKYQMPQYGTTLQ